MELVDVSCPDWLSHTRSIAEATRHLDAELHESKQGGTSGMGSGQVTASSAYVVDQLASFQIELQKVQKVQNL